MFSASRFENIEITERIKHGNHGRVFIGNKNGVIYAIKEITVAWSGLYQGIDRMTLNEMSALISLKGYKEFVTILAAKIEKSTVRLLFPAAACNLTTYIKNLTFPERMSDFESLTNTCLNALGILNNHSIFNGDLKPDNILIYDRPGQGARKEFRICDFSLSAYIFPGSIYDGREYITLTYRPPELLLESIEPLVTRGPDGELIQNRKRICNLKRADPWSLGIILLQMYTGLGPDTILRFKRPDCLYNWILTTSSNGSLDVRSILEREVDSQFLGLIEGHHLLLLDELLKIDARKRWRPVQFVASNQNLKRKVHRYNESLQNRIFKICESADLVFSIALTTLDILTRYIISSNRYSFTEYEEVRVEEIEIILSLKLAYEFYEDVADTLFDMILFYCKSKLGPSATKEEIQEESSKFSIDLCCSKEIEILQRIDFHLMPQYLVNLISTVTILREEYRLTNKKLNAVYSIS